MCASAALRFWEEQRDCARRTRLTFFFGCSRHIDARHIHIPNISIQAAIAAIPANAQILLALGSQHIAPFAARADVHYLIRMVDEPATRLPLPDHELLLAKPGSVEEEFALLRDKRITHVVCRNSGGKASYAKIAAARLLGLPVVMIMRDDNGKETGSIENFENLILSAITSFTGQLFP